MPADIRGGPSRTHRLGNHAEIEAAEAALQARSVQGVRRPLPPPAPLPADMLPDGDVPLADYAVGGRLDPAAPLMVDPPEDTGETSFDISGTVFQLLDGFHVVLTQGRRQFTGQGSSITEALGIAAGELEEGLAQPVCPHCGQVLPTED